VTFLLRTTNFVSHLNQVCKTEIPTAAHGDTLNNLLCKLPIEALESILKKMVVRLIRSRVFESYRLLNKYYLVAIDGTGLHSYNKSHCANCLTFNSKKTGKTRYQHHVLEAKLITPTGMALSIATEFIENPNDKAKETKQDCETKAFYRLAAKLKRMFPRMPICLTMDALYAGKPVFDICVENKWKFIINFKKDDMKNAYEEFESLIKNHQIKNRKEIKTERLRQHFEWATQIDYKGHTLHAIRCIETDNKTNETVTFAWLTNLSVNQENFILIAKGGRLRWTIENQGFNVQKNGYHLEHPYTQNTQAQKNFYRLCQIAHFINQLVEFGSLLKNSLAHPPGSKKNISMLLLIELSTIAISTAQIEAWCSVPTRISLNTA